MKITSSTIRKSLYNGIITKICIKKKKKKIKNSIVLFDDHIYLLQLLAIAMATKYAPPKYSSEIDCMVIIKLLKHYMDGGFIFWP